MPPDRTPLTCSFSVDGLSRVLQGKRGFVCHPREGLNVVVSGCAGSGKTLLVLQMAATATIEDQPPQAMNVVYLSKDTPPETLLDHACNDFLLFNHLEEDAESWEPPPRRMEWARDHPPPDRTRYGEWLLEDSADRRGNRGANVEHFTTMGLPISCEIGARRSIRFVFLDRLMEALDWAGIARESDRSHHLNDCMLTCLGREAEPFFAIGSFHLVTNPASDFEEDLWKGPLIASLGRLCGALRPFFEWLENGGYDYARNLLVVLDSLPPKILEDCLMSQAERPETPEGEPGFSRPLALYVAESPDLPESLLASFPPDVQIKLGFREDRWASRVRTVQILKARFQSVRAEPFPFVIVDRGEVEVGRSFVVRFPTRTLDAPCEAIEIVEDESPDPLGFKIRRPGITILPSIMAVTTCPAEGAARRAPSITFGDKELDSLTLRGDLAGGGCTLLATQNRCNSTAFGLHFLLGAIARSTQRESNDGGAGGAQPGLRSLLYLAIDQDLPGVLHDIWVYPDLRGAIWGNDVDRLAMQEAVSARLSGIRGETRGPSLWLFKIPLRHGACQVREGDGKKGMGPYLYVFTSDIAWCSQEELLERIGQVLDYARHGVDRACASCLTVDRVLFNRVSRVHTRWPLIEDAQVFVSSLAGMCRSRGIELMIIDDTAVQSETSGHISSHWTAISQNIIRLKRVPFHGSEAVALELVRCHGRSPRWNRTMELRSELTTRTASPGAQGHAWKLRLLDSFRGYTGLFSGNPKRCAVKVDLPYDRRGTALYRDMLNTRANLKTLIEGVDVNLTGPEERPGVNSALSNLAYVTQDSCHVAAIDEIWIHRMIGDKPDEGAVPVAESGLAQLSFQEIARALGGQVAAQASGERLTPQKIKDLYVTEAMTIARKKARREEGVYAVPFRHNWGFLAIARLRREAMARLFDEVLGLLFRAESKSGGGACGSAFEVLLRQGTLPQELGGHTFLGFAGVLLDRRDLLGGIGDDRLRRLGSAVHSLIWRDEAEQAEHEVTWSTLVEYKREIWDPVVLKIRERVPAHAHPGELPDGLRHWFRPDTVVSFFDFDRATSESVVSFLLELLLAHCDWDELFKEPGAVGDTSVTYGTASLLYLRTKHSPRQLDQMTNALLCMYRLLSPRQRRELAVGRMSGNHSEIKDGGEDEGEAPRTYELISRVWISTLPDVDPHRDLREGFSKKHLLPAEDDIRGNRLRRVISEGDMGQAEKQLCDECRGKGPTISGTWYLGALSGGNVDVATDVIRELVSEVHERDRMIQGSAAPVTKRFYESFVPEASGGPARYPRYDAPYAKLVGLVCSSRGGREHTDDRQIPTFPFCRSRIREYTSISLDLVQLVRQVMELDEDALGEPSFASRIQECVKRTLAKIRHTYEQRPVEHAEALR